MSYEVDICINKYPIIIWVSSQILNGCLRSFESTIIILHLFIQTYTDTVCVVINEIFQTVFCDIGNIYLFWYISMHEIHQSMYDFKKLNGINYNKMCVTVWCILAFRRYTEKIKSFHFIVFFLYFSSFEFDSAASHV